MSIAAIRAALVAADIESPALPDGREAVQSTFVTYAGTNATDNGLHMPVYVVTCFVAGDGLDDPEATLEAFAASVRETLQEAADMNGMRTLAVDETERVDPELSGNIAVEIPVGWPVTVQ